ncbi:hypothetical protein [uncultured Draconibacterium sp.]|uniref:hypothetical protein n=1 Tax=uncultured Draconibacterium sp. TaxID=1573823 RepID=UPI002AA5FAEE|nr:hypothetical protein [uncultured Draconibacterium sp.]
MGDNNTNYQVTANPLDSFVFWSGKGKIIPHLLYVFFSKLGIGRYFPDDTKWKNSESIIVKIVGNVVSEVNVAYLIEIAKNHIVEMTEESGESGPILDSFHRSTSLFGDKNLKLLPILRLDFISDDKDTGYFFFRNGVVKATAEEITIDSYDEYDEYVWESSIVDLDFTFIDDAELIHNDTFLSFMTDLTKVEDEEKSEKRFISLSTAVGYLLHRFKDGTSTKAIILMDVYVNGMPNGGSGKTLLMTAVGKIRNLAIIDGKKYDQKEWFGLSSVELDTGVVLFDDVKQEFNFELIFPLMSTGLFRRRKYENHVFIPHEKAPKIAITTNYAINGSSNSFKRRMFEFEVSTTYSADYTPRDKYGKNFFDDWSNEEWNYFYNTMIKCLQLFLSDGLIESEPINIRLTKLVNTTCEEFFEFANHKIVLNNQLNKKELYLDFVGDYPEFKTQLRQRTFTNWLRSWGEFKKLKVTEGHTGSVRYVLYSEQSST